MTANAVVLFAKYKNQFKLSDLVSANIRMSLHTSSYTPAVGVAAGHGVYADLTNEVSNGQGYTTGGVSLTGAVAATAGDNGYKVSSGNAVWTASGTGIPAFRYAVLYYTGSLWGVTSPLLGYILCDNTPADIPLTTSGNTLTITCPATGWFDLV